MRRALALVALLSVLTWARVAFTGEYSGGWEPTWGLAPFDTALPKISGRGGARPRVPEPARVILWDEEPPKGTPSAHHAQVLLPRAAAAA
jgi:hypothetical protein